jgi:hypothetical protein
MSDNSEAGQNQQMSSLSKQMSSLDKQMSLLGEQMSFISKHMSLISKHMSPTNEQKPLSNEQNSKDDSLIVLDNNEHSPASKGPSSRMRDEGKFINSASQIFQ